MSAASVRRLLPVAAWPEIDRRLWEAANAGPYAATLNADALPVIAEGYGRWIAVLRSQGRLDEDVHPADRVTPESVAAYIEGLREAGNKRTTIRARLSQLITALRMMAPHRSFTWLHPSKLLRADDHQASLSSSNATQLRGWPALDQELWKAGIVVSDILDGPQYASRLRPRTLETIVVGYRRWLTFLREHGLLDPTATPAARVTPKNVAAYFRSLRTTNGNASVIARFTELRAALRIMHPDLNFRWLTSPHGQSLETLLPITKKPIEVIHSRVLYEWGQTMMRDALLEANPEKRRIGYRNGLLIAFFAARAPRVRSMASLRLGRTVLRNGNAYKLVFENDDIKTGRRLEYDTPPELTAAIDRYIRGERAELLMGKSCGAFWLDKYGEPLSADNIADMIHR